MRMRLDEADDLLHVPDDDPTFNESRYYNVFDAGSGLGGWVRLGNRPNEGYAERTVCLYLPDGRVGFSFARPKISGHEAHDAGGLRFEVITPFQEHRVSYAGTVCLLEHPREMVDPKAALTNNPHVPCVLDLRVTAAGGQWGGELELDEGETPPPGSQHGFATGHSEQHMALTGTATIGGETFEIAAGRGLRDHSWGPRIWQSIWWYRWCNASFEDFGVSFTVRGEEGWDSRHAKGFVYDRRRYGDARVVPIRDIELSSVYDEELFPIRNHLVVTTDDERYELDGDIRSSIPLRNRRDGKVTRLTEGMTRWTCGDRVGAGLSEYLDQIVDDVAVGIAAGV